VPDDGWEVTYGQLPRRTVACEDALTAHDSGNDNAGFTRTRSGYSASTSDDPAQRSRQAADDRQQRVREDEEHDEAEQPEVLIEAPVDLSRPGREVQADDPRAVEPRQRYQVEHAEREVRDHERAARHSDLA